MKIFLLWRRMPEQDWDAERVAPHLRSIFAPLFRKLPEPTIRQTSAASLAFLELPVRGWKPPFSEEDAEGWALAPDYPVNAQAVLEVNGTRCRDDGVLLALGRRLQEDPAPLLREMAPPFSLIWASKRTGEVFVQNDGIGQAPLFEYRSGTTWALTNRIMALKALGLPLEPVPEDWAVRWTLGWFPLDLTGYRSIRHVEPAIGVCVSNRGIRRTKHDLLSEWLNPEKLSRKDCLELARSSLLEHVNVVLPQMETPTLGFSGGWDSRAVASLLRASGADFSMSVRGQPWRADVVVAQELAEIAGIDLKVRVTIKRPPDNVDACRRSISCALLRQAGERTARSYKTFLANKKGLLNPGSARITGHLGELGRTYYGSRIKGGHGDANRHDERLVDTLIRKMPSITRKRLRNVMREQMLEVCGHADAYGLSGARRWDFFYLCERNRRLIGSHASATTGLNFTPFFHPDYIRAVFAFPDEDRSNNPFHRHIIATLAPDWADAGFEIDLKKDQIKKGIYVSRAGEKMNKAPNRVKDSNWKRPYSRDDYDNKLYWQEVAKPLIDECLEREGFWTEIFDPDLAREHWISAPDELAIMHLLPEVLQRPV